MEAIIFIILLILPFWWIARFERIGLFAAAAYIYLYGALSGIANTVLYREGAAWHSDSMEWYLWTVLFGHLAALLYAVITGVIVLGVQKTQQKKQTADEQSPVDTHERSWQRIRRQFAGLSGFEKFCMVGVGGYFIFLTVIAVLVNK